MSSSSLSGRLDEAARVVDEMRDAGEGGSVEQILETTAHLQPVARSLPSPLAGVAERASDVSQPPEQLDYIAQSLRLASLVAFVIEESPLSATTDESRKHILLGLLGQVARVESVTVVLHPVITSLVEGDPALLLRRMTTDDGVETDEVELPSVALSPSSREGDPLLDDTSLAEIGHRAVRDLVERTLSGGALKLGRHVAFLLAEARVVGDELELHLAVSLAKRIATKVWAPEEGSLVWVWASEVGELSRRTGDMAEDSPPRPDRPIQTRALELELARVGEQIGASKDIQFGLARGTPGGPPGPY